jgi:hypothetical protein
MNGSDKKFELTKMYSQTGFQDDDTSIGYAINVFQDTIGKTFREYLVNFNYFIRIMEDYGFVVISKDEANQKGLPNGTGLFEELFNDMQAETRYAPRRKNDYKNAHLMTDDEKQISYMNRYFVFTKVRNVDGTNIYKNLTHKTAEELDVKTDPERVIIRRKSKKITITEDENK